MWGRWAIGGKDGHALMICTHVLHRGACEVCRPGDGLAAARIIFLSNSAQGYNANAGAADGLEEVRFMASGQIDRNED